MSELVKISISDSGVADVRLNRSDKYNALNLDMFKAITEAGESLKSNKEIRAIVLSGEGKGFFCAGLDMMSVMSEPGGATGENGERFEPEANEIANFFQKPAYVWSEQQVPVIAALHGAAYGGGFQIAMGADIRIAREDAKLSIMEIKWGLIPDMSAFATLPNIVNMAVAKDLTYTGRIVESEEALRIGLVNQVVNDHMESAFELAELIASKSPDAIRAGKQLIENSWGLSAKEAMKMEADVQKTVMGGENQIEAVMANMQNREPKYKPTK
jgi:enoyl-CoA hydratase/carnithine racemase